MLLKQNNLGPFHPSEKVQMQAWYGKTHVAFKPPLFGFHPPPQSSTTWKAEKPFSTKYLRENNEEERKKSMAKWLE